jgi:NAD(P)-dependent dehydrogenase (short-subunit alcohol dehydrogenase family)
MSKARDLAGRTILITGANTGIGRTAALALGRRGARLYLAGRSEERHRPVLDALRAEGQDAAHFLPLELGDLASVRACAERFLATGEPLHVLINNAGLAGQKGVTADGFEKTFGVNHLGHFLLTELLLERLKASAPSRVVIVASRAHTRVRGVDFDALRRPTASGTGFPEYGVSKLCNVLHARELARRLEGSGVSVFALHPGVVATDVWREVPWPLRGLAKLFMRSDEEGAAPTLHCAAAPGIEAESGSYYDELRRREPSRVARDEALAAELWAKSEAWTGLRSA